jgi:hypothetical protein
MFLLCVVFAAKKEDDSFWSAMAGLLEERFRVLRACFVALQRNQQKAKRTNLIVISITSAALQALPRIIRPSDNDSLGHFFAVKR